MRLVRVPSPPRGKFTKLIFDWESEQDFIYAIHHDGVYQKTVADWTLEFTASHPIGKLGTTVYFTHEDDALLWMLTYEGRENAFK